MKTNGNNQKTCYFYAETRDQWRNWLERNHNTEKEIWLVFFKKHSLKPSVTYNEAVEEALCFGWIDSLVRSIDEISYCQKFTPRKKNSRWSGLNRSRVLMLLEKGMLTQAGLDKLPDDLMLNPEQSLSQDGGSYKQEITKFSTEIENELKTNQAAWLNFNNMASSHKKNYIMWVMSAKKPETRLKRIREAVELLEKNMILRMK